MLHLKITESHRCDENHLYIRTNWYWKWLWLLEVWQRPYKYLNINQLGCQKILWKGIQLATEEKWRISTYTYKTIQFPTTRHQKYEKWFFAFIWPLRFIRTKLFLCCVLVVHCTFSSSFSYADCAKYFQGHLHKTRYTESKTKLMNFLIVLWGLKLCFLSWA